MTTITDSGTASTKARNSAPGRRVPVGLFGFAIHTTPVRSLSIACIAARRVIPACAIDRAATPVQEWYEGFGPVIPHDTFPAGCTLCHEGEDWSTIRADERMSPDRSGFESVVLFVDGEPFPLELAGWTLDAIGVTQPVYVKPVASAADAYYHVTLDQVRLLATAQQIDLRVGTARPVAYELWDEQTPARAALQEFGRRGYD